MDTHKLIFIPIPPSIMTKCQKSFPECGHGPKLFGAPKLFKLEKEHTFDKASLMKSEVFYASILMATHNLNYFIFFEE